MRFTPIEALLLLMCSCTVTPLELRDNSFGLRAEVISRDETLRSELCLTLDRGDASDNYTMTYRIDEDPTLKLQDQEGNEVLSGASLSFDGYINRRFTLPILAEGEHRLSLRLSTDNYSKELNVPFEVIVAPFSLHAEVLMSESSSATSIILSLSKGIADKEYRGAVYVGGASCDSTAFSVNFSKTPALVVELPVCRPGSRTARVRATDGKTSSSCTQTFDEPLRFKDLDIYIDNADGYTRFSTGANPYRLSMSVRDSLYLKGEVSYDIIYGYFGETRTKKEYNERIGETLIDSFIPEEGVWYNISDKGRLSQEITSEHRSSWSVKTFWDSAAECLDYMSVYLGENHFKVIEDRQFIDFDIEKIEGISVHVHCSESGCIINSHVMDSDIYSYEL